MARAFVTGSSTGLGLMAAQLLLELGHRVVVHGRTQARADVALAAAPRADAAVIGDLSKIGDMRSVAEQVNKLGEFDAVIHNAGIGYRESRRTETEDRLPALFATNTLAPYVLTARCAARTFPTCWPPSSTSRCSGWRTTARGIGCSKRSASSG